MGLTKEALAQRLQLEGYPRASAYDPEWVLENLMGPNVLWLAEALSQELELRPGMRVLDMGYWLYPCDCPAEVKDRRRRLCGVSQSCPYRTRIIFRSIPRGTRS